MGNAATFVVAAFGLAVAPAVPSWAGADSGDGRMTETAAAATSSSSVPTNQGPRCNAVGDGRGTQISVTLDEWSVEPDPASAPPGKTTFRATNDGLEPHELVIVKGDDPAALPVQDNLVDEDSLPEGAFVGEIEEFRAGSRCPGTFELDPGPYVLFCNIENHYQDGMYAGFTVAAPPPPAAEPEAGAAPDPPSATPPAATAPTREPSAAAPAAPSPEGGPPAESAAPSTAAKPPRQPAAATPDRPAPAPEPAPSEAADTETAPDARPGGLARTGPSRTLAFIAGAAFVLGGFGVAVGRRRRAEPIRS